MSQFGRDGSNHLTQGGQREGLGFTDRPTEGCCDSFVHIRYYAREGSKLNNYFQTSSRHLATQSGQQLHCLILGFFSPVAISTSYEQLWRVAAGAPHLQRFDFLRGFGWGLDALVIRTF